MQVWYVSVNGKEEGPYTFEQIHSGMSSRQFTWQTLVRLEKDAEWQAIGSVPDLAHRLGKPVKPVQESAPATDQATGQDASDQDYRLHGREMQYVEIELDRGESAVADAGAMIYMDDGIAMQTLFGDGSGPPQKGGFLDKLVGAGKRLITGESLFCTVFTNQKAGKAKVAFAAPYPGKIVPLDLRNYKGRLICQKDAFLCAAKGVSIGMALKKRIGTALFGGEGFIMQKLEGDGLVFIHAGGAILERELNKDEILRVDTGSLVAVTPTVKMDIKFVANVKSAIFGDEGYFFANLSGPGHIWLQSMPFSRLTGRIHQAAPRFGLSRKVEGPISDLSALFQE